MSSPTLVFTIAQNGYASLYRSCLRSQRSYADRFGYTYCAVTRPTRVADPALSAWLKVPLLHHAITHGYDTVLFVDADCRISSRAPALDVVVDATADVHMARGRTGRWNSGVVVARRSSGSSAYLARVLESMTDPVSEEDRAHLKYENGNLIHVARQFGGVAELDPRWNNMTRPELADFVRHYTGDMRADLRSTPAARALVRGIARTIPAPRRQPAQRSAGFRQALERLTQKAFSQHPALRGPIHDGR